MDSSHPDAAPYRDDIHCPDDGRCSHPTSCEPEGACWRVLNSSPFANYGEDWPQEVRDDPRPLPGPASEGDGVMGTDRQHNPACHRCGVETLHHSDHSGGWDECPYCGWMQDIRHTPGGDAGVLTGVDPEVTCMEKSVLDRPGRRAIMPTHEPRLLGHPRSSLR